MLDRPEIRLSDQPQSTIPLWENEGNESFAERLTFFLRRIIEILMFNVVHCRSVTKHLRYLGTRIGSNCSICNKVNDFGSEPWLIEIGSSVTIAVGAALITHDGASRLFRDRIVGMNAFGNRFGTIVIHDNSFIGENVIILPGIEIGPNSIVGAGSVVTKTVPQNSVVVGNPARVLYTLDEYIDRYQQKMLPLQASDRKTLRKELTRLLWGRER